MSNPLDPKLFAKAMSAFWDEPEIGNEAGVRAALTTYLSGPQQAVQPRVTSTHNAAGLLRLYINRTLHLAFVTDKVAGIQSWKMTTRQPPMFVIEITPIKGLPILCDYDTEALWEEVLAEIDRAFGRVANKLTGATLTLGRAE